MWSNKGNTLTLIGSEIIKEIVHLKLEFHATHHYVRGGYGDTYKDTVLQFHGLQFHLVDPYSAMYSNIKKNMSCWS